ncbi:MAG: carbohydrate-binding protein, partial [Acetatifactor sp.]|nr:carbohydrate-binding protein [Acetatifactor sp.]
MKKRLLSCMLCIAMVLTAVGCGQEQTEAPAEETQEEVQETVEEEPEETVEEVEETVEEEAAPESSALDAAGRIEFENFEESEGVGTEGSNDDDTDSLAGLNKSGYTSYTIDLHDGGYKSMAIRYSSGTEGGKVEIHYMAPDGDLIGEAELPGTGDWSNYTTVNVDLPNLEAFAREKTLYFVFSGDEYLYNLNWFQLYQVADASNQIECESFAGSEGVVVEGTSDATGGDNLGGIQNGFWTSYKLDFGEGGFEQVSFRASSAMEEGGDVEIRLGAVDGELVGTCKIPGTGDWSNWDTFTAELPDLAKVTGTQDVYMVYTNGGDWLFNLN